MVAKKQDTFLKYSGLFAKSLPNTLTLLLILTLLSAIAGISVITLIHYKIAYDIKYLLVNGFLTGIMALLLPTLFTAVVIRALRQRLAMKYLLFLAMIGELYYIMFLIAGSLVYLFLGNSVIASTVVIVGDAGIFAWWLFLDKVIFGDRKKAALGAIVQPTMNLLLYLPASTFIFSLSGPLGILLLKLYGGIAIFLAVGYITIYIFEKPMKGGLGISGVDTFSQMIQNWLFNFTITVPKENARKSFGKKADIQTKTLLFKDMAGKQKALFFIPEVHFGPAGVMGGSNFPYALEKHARGRYKLPVFVMHGAVNEDYNPISDMQFGQIRAALDTAVSSAVRCKPKIFGISYSTSSYNGASIKLLNFGCAGMTTFTCAPKVTEDIDPTVALTFAKMLEGKTGDPILVDAHNSRYESAPEEELEGVKFNSRVMGDYIKAIDALNGPEHRSKAIRLGVSSVNIYRELGQPADLGPGNLNLAIFRFNGFNFAMLLFNCNNMLPSLRNDILAYLKKRHGLESEVYTTDTHYVNSLREDASNVLGRKTGFSDLRPLIDKAVDEAIRDIGAVQAYYKSVTVRRFVIWGHSSREKIRVALDTSISMAKTFVPITIVGGLILASWVISLI